MFTNNYINMKESEFLGDSTGTVIDYQGNKKTFYIESSGNGDNNYRDIGRYLREWIINPSTLSSNSHGGGLCFGQGATPPSRDDYCLAEFLPDGACRIQIVHVKEKDVEKGKYSFVSDLAVRNTSETEITIREIGIFTRPLIATGTKEAYAVVLMERTVLNEPITIPVGESRLITYKLVFNHS